MWVGHKTSSYGTTRLLSNSHPIHIAEASQSLLVLHAKINYLQCHFKKMLLTKAGDSHRCSVVIIYARSWLLLHTSRCRPSHRCSVVIQVANNSTLCHKTIYELHTYIMDTILYNQLKTSDFSDITVLYGYSTWEIFR